MIPCNECLVFVRCKGRARELRVKYPGATDIAFNEKCISLAKCLYNGGIEEINETRKLFGFELIKDVNLGYVARQLMDLIKEEG